jgi:membrane-associated phospholipid phosphatase
VYRCSRCGDANTTIRLAPKRSSLMHKVRMGVRSSNLTDRLYLFTFALASLGIMLRPDRVTHWTRWLVVNGVCIVVIGLLIRKQECSNRWEFLHDWYPLGMFVVCFEEVSRLSLLLWHQWQDQYLLRFEAVLFPVPSTVWLSRFHSPVLTELMEVGYFSYFVLFTIVGLALYRPERKQPFRHMTDATVLSYLLCYIVFVFFPTEGPAHTLAAHPPTNGALFHWAVTFIQARAGVHGNAFPSAHVAGAFVALLSARRYAAKLGLFLAPLVGLLCVGAVYDGYHYVSDVVAGVIVGVIPAVWIMRIERSCREISFGSCPN